VSSVEQRIEVINRALGHPTVQVGRAQAYKGDCLSLLKRIPDGVFDLVVTSPPYNIGKAYEEVRPLENYISWCREWLAEIARVLSSNGAFWLNLGYVPVPERGRAIPLPYLLWDAVPMHFIQEVVWNYGAGVAARRSFSPRNEKFLWYVKNPENYVFNLDDVRDSNVKYPNQKKNGKLKCNPLGKNPSDVWQFPKVTSGANRSSKERTLHPAQFPAAVIDRIIKACSSPDALVLDPFLGSGTTAEVALQRGRASVGIEINGHYLDIVRERLHRAVEPETPTVRPASTPSPRPSSRKSELEQLPLLGSGR